MVREWNFSDFVAVLVVFGNRRLTFNREKHGIVSLLRRV